MSEAVPIGLSESQQVPPISLDTLAGDIVSILVSSDPPYGIILEPDIDGNAAIIKSFEKLPNGKIGTIQKHGGIHIGDILFAINEVQLDAVTHSNAMIMVNDRNILKKTFKFMNIREYYRRRRGAIPNATISAENSKVSFLSSIRRYRVSTDESSKKFVEYEVAASLRVPGARVQRDIVHKWSIWKRYSEFEKLNRSLRVSLGWQLEGVEFPSPHTFSLNKMTLDFIEQRRDELNSFWQRVISIDRVTEFTKHHCSEELKAFLDVEEVMKGAKVHQSDGVESADDAKDSEDEEKRSTGRRGMGRAASIRRRSIQTSSQRIPAATSPSPAMAPPPASSVTSQISLATQPASPPPPPPPPGAPAHRPPPPARPPQQSEAGSS